MTSPLGEPAQTDGGLARILSAAEALFAKNGYHATSISAVAKAAGVSKANVFHHFASKDELYLSVLRATCRATTILDQLEASAGDPSEQIRHFAAAHLVGLFENERGSRLILREAFESGATGGQLLAEQVVSKPFEQLVALIRGGQEAGILRANIDPAAAAVFLVGGNLLFFQGREVIRHLPGVTFADAPEQFSLEVAQIFFDGLKARASKEMEGN